jgi:hypothetical protein
VIKVLYKPLSLVVSVAGGIAAAALFNRLWRVVGHNEEAPNATDQHFGWREVLTAAAIQGALFGAVKAAVDRAGAAGFARATGTWPS